MAALSSPLPIYVSFCVCVCVFLFFVFFVLIFSGTVLIDFSIVARSSKIDVLHEEQILPNKAKFIGTIKQQRSNNERQTSSANMASQVKYTKLNSATL